MNSNLPAGITGECVLGMMKMMLPVEPGYKVIEFKPYIPEDLESISVTYESVVGTAGSVWQQTGENLVLTITVPNNSRGRVYISAASREDVTIETDNGGELAAFVRVSDGRVIYEVWAGSYNFTVQK